MYIKYFKTCFIIFLICLVSSQVFADRSSTTIDAPDRAKKESIITIRITVTHNGNNFMHYTNWVYIKINGKQIARWDFKWKELPESEIFTREVSYTVEGPFTIESEANCNLHGSKGKTVKKVEL